VREKCRSSQKKIVDTEVEEEQNVDINDLHCNHRLSFDYSTEQGKMLSKVVCSRKKHSPTNKIAGLRMKNKWRKMRK
jgi:uncharacterized protein YgiM (DUF1202 family)